MKNNEQQKSECKTCKQKGPGTLQIGSIILGFYILISSIYGTIFFLKEIVNFFK
jgi:hypothetical protein